MEDRRWKSGVGSSKDGAGEVMNRNLALNQSLKPGVRKGTGSLTRECVGSGLKVLVG
ncbi:hypothetical protein [Membranihabitans maritimus]|uniref:hypothetical protein n=1 Tax=Membranihabitans maritimus TaxID=2904244 RepID=UPI001F3BF088|nr:hypothetical protein [Membranihabitans maritimus]